MTLSRLQDIRFLNDEFKIVKIGNARIGMVGVVTGGRYPHMIHGNLDNALVGNLTVSILRYCSPMIQINGPRQLPVRQILILHFQDIHMECRWAL